MHCWAEHPARQLSAGLVQELLQHGADVNLQESGSKSTPLHIAVRECGSSDSDKSAASSGKAAAAMQIAKAIIASGKVDFSVRDSKQDTALHSAVKTTNAALVADIVDAGADTNPYDSSGRSALHLAIDANSAAGTEIALRLVLAEQTHVNLLSEQGNPPLLLAVKTVNLKVWPPNTLAKHAATSCVRVRVSAPRF
ncbi:hypothetical protein GPECTOR_44g11 [Gonium pectorale]|uniref:Uncharacterized protein n=1 Tax=Gonium pectorale TaxID=33097 RepID=A0A150G909_GONPE|nr:hypothetical protein GPECTOR_44g11 [Gonium pectorale]|eukprot:KXZ46332.1 hypothetical protein GPECTOR_44g11 [Gonium pectorale]